MRKLNVPLESLSGELASSDPFRKDSADWKKDSQEAKEYATNILHKLKEHPDLNVTKYGISNDNFNRTLETILDPLTEAEKFYSETGKHPMGAVLRRATGMRLSHPDSLRSPEPNQVHGGQGQ